MRFKARDECEGCMGGGGRGGGGGEAGRSKVEAQGY